jgi:hypothetical protein
LFGGATVRESYQKNIENIHEQTRKELLSLQKQIEKNPYQVAESWKKIEAIRQRALYILGTNLKDADL